MKNKDMKEEAFYKTEWLITKYESEEAYERGEPYEESKFDGNLLLNEGITMLWTLSCLTGGTKFDNSNAYLGVGDSSNGESASQTGLQGSNKTYKAMDTGYPQVSTTQCSWKSTFGSGDANYTWNEFTVANGNSDSATNLNRKVSNQGTKTAGQVWELTLTITLS